MARFYLDNDVPVALAASLTSLGHSATHTQQLRRERANDAEQLATSVQRAAVFVTNNGRDFILLNRAWNLWSTLRGGLPPHQGILILRHATFPHGEWAEQIERMVSGTPDLENRVYRWHSGTTNWQHVQ